MLAVLLFGLLAAPFYAAAAVISYNATHLAAGQWQLDYQITAGAAEPEIQEFTVYFDVAHYRNLVVAASPGGWDSLVAAPDPGLPADGFFDALALSGGIPSGGALGGFSVLVDVLGIDRPAPQLFEIVDPASFTIISSGLTVPQTVVAVAEPKTLALLLLGGALLLATGGRRRVLHARWLWVLLPLWLAGCGGAADPALSDTRTTQLLSAATATAAVPQVVVSGLQKVGELRTGRTEFEYTFRITVKNQDRLAHNGVVATLTAAGAGAVIVQGRVAVGTLAAGASVMPAGLVTIRQDRMQAFNPAALAWQVTADDAPPELPGILVPGDAAAAAVTQLPDFIADLNAAQLTTADDPALAMRYYVSQLQAAIASSASVERVNAALVAEGARIVYSQQNASTITLGVPAAGSAAALRAVAQRLEDSGAFDAVGVIYIPVEMGLPRNVSAAMAVSPQGPLLHHIAAHAAPVWPGQGEPLPALKDVVVVIVDYFGAGTSPRLLKEVGSTLHTEEFSSVDPGDHGYHVLGILAGGFGGAEDKIGSVTGILPANVDLHVIDLKPQVKGSGQYTVVDGGKTKLVSWYVHMTHRLKQIIRAQPDKRYVVNFSLGYCKGRCAELPQADQERLARVWRKFVRELATKAFMPEEKILLVSAAGNNYGRQAGNASFFNAAVTFSVLKSAAPPYEQILPLNNGLVVENRKVSAVTGSRPLPDCLSESSNIDGTIGAIGDQVYSFTGPDTAGFNSGTSMAAPQAAGLAAWMWGTRPDLTAPAITAILRARAYVPEGLSKDPCRGAPMIDVMAALQALDREAPPAAPVRLRQLQPDKTTPQAVFGMDDAEQFLKRIFPKGDGQTAANVAEYYSAYDLNGDGRVGDLNRARYDLKYDRPSTAAAAFEVLTAYPKGGATKLDEAGTTDFEVLCYYVNSDLFRETDRAAFDTRLKAIAAAIGRPVSCGVVDQVELRVETGNPNWQGLPGTVLLSSFTLSDIARFIREGSPGNTCGGERGFPSFSATVDGAARLLAVSVVQGMPSTVGGPAINRRPCSSFYAARSYAAGLPDQVWINASGRAQRFVDTQVTDWEYQIRYTNGDPRAPLPGAGKRCEVGLVPGSGVFSKHFDAVCSHSLTSSGVME
jgi:hypothetical protein